jgi:hypothetical protein
MERLPQEGYVSENGKWKMENGKWKMENGKWKMENGKWKMAKFGIASIKRA